MLLACLVLVLSAANGQALVQPGPAEERVAAEALLHATREEPAAARDHVEALMADHPDTLAAALGRRLAWQLAAVGAPEVRLPVREWLSERPADLADTRVHLLAFLDLSSPACVREARALAEAYPRWRARGVEFVALTHRTRGVTPDQVRGAIRQWSLGFPVGELDDWTAEAAYHVDTVPAVVVIADGVVRWRGSPTALTEAVLAGYP
jgi:hypothetical protein